jgi:hypothetical protein
MQSPLKHLIVLFRSFVNFGSWINRAFEYAHVGSKLSEAKAWALVTHLLVAVFFSEMYVVHMGTKQAMNSDRRSMCTAILWSVFRTHDKMTDFEDANFEDHPAVSSEYISSWPQTLDLI